MLNLTSNSLEKTKQIKKIVCGCLGKRAKLAIGVCVCGGVRENVQHFGPGGNKENC